MVMRIGNLNTKIIIFSVSKPWFDPGLIVRQGLITIQKKGKRFIEERLPHYYCT
jgi:hypothetical protein